MNNKLNYGNWVSDRMMRLWSIASIVLIFISIISFCPLTFMMNWSEYILWTVRILLLIITIVSLIVTVYMGICHHLFSYTGGQISSKILDYVLEHLEWDGEGTLIDIGCGSGALTIKAAKKYPKATLTGIDYWGTIWNYAKEQCECNASAEGVNERITFMKGDAASLAFPDESFDAAVSNFVFHEVKSQPDKRLVVKEALRMVKKGGVFAFHDLFLQETLYGNMKEFVQELKAEGLSEITLVESRNENFIPGILKVPSMLGNIGLIYGKK
ncbi:MAG: class I SAM-dependent methyltransferase [Ruminiclostridium sp.]